MSTRQDYLDLITELSLHSGYHKYEISDILHSLAVVSCRELQKGNEVYLEGIGTLILQEKPEQLFVSGLSGKRTIKKPKISARIKIDRYMSNGLNLKESKNV